MNNADGTIEHLFSIQHLLISRYPDGYTRQELADRYGVSVRTINRYLVRLQNPLYRFPIERDEGKPWKWRLMKGPNITLPPVYFKPEDAIALTLAARLLARYADRRNQSLINALEKLVSIIPNKTQPYIHRVIDNMLERNKDSVFDQVFQAVVNGWTAGRVVAVDYPTRRSETGQDTYYMKPYLIHPSVVGHATYLIGRCKNDPPERQYRTLKLERAIDAVVTDEMYEIPDDFDGVALLDTAWEVWYQDPSKPLIEVVLRFIPSVTPRVRESYWHPAQRIRDDPENENGCIWSVKIASTTEITPWVRQWGHQVEVLEPPELRELIADQMREAVGIYEK